MLDQKFQKVNKILQIELLTRSWISPQLSFSTSVRYAKVRPATSDDADRISFDDPPMLVKILYQQTHKLAIRNYRLADNCPVIFVQLFMNNKNSLTMK